MPAQLDDDVAPPGLQNMEGVVVHVWAGVLEPYVSAVQDLKDGGLSSTFNDQEDAFAHVSRGPVLFRDFEFMLACCARSNWDMVNPRPGPESTAESSCQPDEVRIIELVFSTLQLMPPDPKSGRALSEPEVGIQNDAIERVIQSIQKFDASFA